MHNEIRKKWRSLLCSKYDLLLDFLTKDALNPDGIAGVLP
jgi:hypothetical protein